MDVVALQAFCAQHPHVPAKQAQAGDVHEEYREAGKPWALCASQNSDWTPFWFPFRSEWAPLGGPHEFLSSFPDGLL